MSMTPQRGSVIFAQYDGGRVERGRSVCEVTRQSDGRIRIVEHNWVDPEPKRLTAKAPSN